MAWASHVFAGASGVAEVDTRGATHQMQMRANAHDMMMIMMNEYKMMVSGLKAWSLSLTTGTHVVALGWECLRCSAAWNCDCCFNVRVSGSPRLQLSTAA